MPRRERTLRDTVCRALLTLDAIAVENPALPGTPDVNYVEGWIELKSWERWPVGEDTILRMDHWTPQQRVRHIRRARAGGRTLVLLEIVQSKDYLLLDGDVAARIMGRATRAQLEAAARARWPSKQAMRAELPDLLSTLNRTPPPAWTPPSAPTPTPP